MKKFLIILLLPISIFSQNKLQLDSLRYYIHNNLNEYRLKYNLDTLEQIFDINTKAQYWAEKMYNENKLYHSHITDGENIMKGISIYDNLKQTSYMILQTWKESIGHNKNLLFKNYKKVGYGFYKGYAVMMFEYGIYNGI
tara:strand:- start:1976 stop:2395 length:420 start_codon:yes stop_codon:yes gene_type:complete